MKIKVQFTFILLFLPHIYITFYIAITSYSLYIYMCVCVCVCVCVSTGFGSLSLLRLVVPCTSTQTQTIELFQCRDGKAIIIEWLPKLRANDVVHSQGRMNQAIDEKKCSSITYEEKFLYMFYFSFVKQYTVYFSISIPICFFDPLSCRASFPLYILLFSILALHLYAPKLFPGYLSHQGSAEGGRRDCQL